MEGEPPVPLPQGALDLLILRTIAREPQHGWAISQRIQLVSRDLLRVQQGSLYPALHRLERRGLIRAEWGVSEHHRRAKYYSLTRKGETKLKAQTRAWRTLTFAIGEILETT